MILLPIALGLFFLALVAAFEQDEWLQLMFFGPAAAAVVFGPGVWFGISYRWLPEIWGSAESWSASALGVTLAWWFVLGSVTLFDVVESRLSRGSQ